MLRPAPPRWAPGGTAELGPSRARLEPGPWETKTLCLTLRGGGPPRAALGALAETPAGPSARPPGPLLDSLHAPSPRVVRFLNADAHAPACPTALPAGVRSLSCVPRAPLRRTLPSSPLALRSFWRWALTDLSSQSHGSQTELEPPHPRPLSPDRAPAPCSLLPVPPQPAYPGWGRAVSN